MFVRSGVVYAAEGVGKPVSLVAVPGNDPCGLILQAAAKLRSSRAVISQSSQTSLDEQKQDINEAWEELEPAHLPVSVELIPDDDGKERVQIDLAEGVRGENDCRKR